MIANDDKYMVGYHTQENRETVLLEPVKCTSKDAWLGEGFYFWKDEQEADNWGIQYKKPKYQVYSASLDMSNVLNAYSYIEGLEFWEEKVNLVLDKLSSEGKRYTANEVNTLLYDLFWSKLNITGIIIADKPKRKYLPPVFNRRRAQVVMFSLATITEFKLLKSN